MYYRFATGLLIVVAAIVASCMLTGCATTPGLTGGGKTISMPAVTLPPADAPICTVVQAPNPLFLGKHICTVRSAPGSGREWANPVWYRLEKNTKGDFVFYYDFSPSRGSGLQGYFPAKLDGDKMTFVGPSGKTLQFFVKGRSVYFTSPTGEGDFEMASVQ